jgi:acyl dehydratase
MRIFTAPEELLDFVGQRLGKSDYRQIDQRQIDLFGQLTGDEQWIHTDPARAGEGTFGSTVAHGFFTLSLLTPMLADIFCVQATDLVLNKGLDRLRFSRPVPVGAKVRAVADLVSVTSRPRGFTETVIAVAVEIEGERRPAYTVQHRLLFHRAPVDKAPTVT